MAKLPLTPDVLTPSLVSKRELDIVIAKAKADPTAVRTLRCRTVALGRLHQLNYIRNLPPQPVMEDEPEGLLGESTAPNASEALLAALGSCLSIGIHASLGNSIGINLFNFLGNESCMSFAVSGT